MTGKLPQRFSVPVAISRVKRIRVFSFAPALKVRW